MLCISGFGTTELLKINGKVSLWPKITTKLIVKKKLAGFTIADYYFNRTKKEENKDREFSITFTLGLLKIVKDSSKLVFVSSKNHSNFDASCISILYWHINCMAFVPRQLTNQLIRL